jgi:ribosomal protein S18 acetylase RimI-like enzyme
MKVINLFRESDDDVAEAGDMQTSEPTVSIFAMNLSFRPIDASDRDFLCAVYANTRTEELAQVDWNENQKTAFLEMQFSAQHQYYQEHYTETDFLIILLGNQPIGRFYIARWTDEIRIVDLALLPEYRNVGIGTQILRDVLSEASTLGKPIRIHVERFNPAQGLYRRLGFAKTGEHGVYDLMEWSGKMQGGESLSVGLNSDRPLTQELVEL